MTHRAGELAHFSTEKARFSVGEKKRVLKGLFFTRPVAQSEDLNRSNQFGRTDLTAVPKQVRGRDYDGAYRSSPEVRSYAIRMRRLKRLAGICINASLTGGPSRTGRVHGLPDLVSGKCPECCETARRTR